MSDLENLGLTIVLILVLLVLGLAVYYLFQINGVNFIDILKGLNI